MVISKLVGASAVVLALILSIPSIATADGKDIFLEKKCNKCHEVTSLQIQKLPKEANAAEDEDAEDGEQVEKVDPPDLAKIGDKLRKEYGSDAAAKDYLAKYLKKEVANKKDHKHKKKYTLEPASFDALSSWLLTL